MNILVHMLRFVYRLFQIPNKENVKKRVNLVLIKFYRKYSFIIQID